MTVTLDMNQKLIATATKEGSLYYVNCGESEHVCAEKANVHKESKEQVWHRRYGHLGMQNLKKMCSESLVDGFDFDVSKDIDFCESCVAGKHHRSMFKTNGRKRAVEPFGLVHSDVCEKMNAKSLSGAEYFLTFIDDNTHYVWTYVLKHKDEVFQKFQEWKALVEKDCGKQLKILRADNGGEYTSADFQNFLKTKGIRHELTIPKTPEQNGGAERMNKTLMETVRSMLADAKLPQRFWAEALSTAVYLRNKSPTKSVEGMTSFEAWTGKKPKVDYLHVFGCIAYAHIPKDERKKLDFKAKKCIFLGYGSETKGYRLYDLKKAKVFYSRDVIFNESERAVEEPERDKEGAAKHYVKFDCQEPDKEDSTNSTACQNSTRNNSTEQELQKPERTRKPPDRYGEWVTLTSTSIMEPKMAKDALSSPDKAEWKEAMEKEMESLYANNVWKLVELPKDRKTVGSKWVFKVKADADGIFERYKACLVAQGFSQKFGLDYDETFSPVVRFESVRTIIALAAQHGLQLHQMDVKTAFLNGELKEEVYMEQPGGFVVEGKEHPVCKLNRSIYGLKQSPRCWNIVLDNQLKKMGFVQTPSDPCIYTTETDEMFIIAVYVDDILLAGHSNKRMTEVKKLLARHFELTDMGELTQFLGVKTVQKPKTEEIWMGQTTYTKSVLKKFDMENSKPVATPVDINTKLVKPLDDEGIDQTRFQSAVGSLLYL